MLTWKQAAADYEKKSAGSNTAGTTPPTSGVLSWKQAADEFDRYDEDGYKALGMQRMTQMQERYQAQKDRVSGLERLHADDTVNDWLNRYNRVIQGITRSEQKRNGGFTRDADSVYEAEIDALLSGYDGIKNHSEIRQYYDSLTELKNSLNAINDSFSQFEDESAFDQYMAYWKDQEEKKNLDLDSYSREIAALEQQLEDYDPQIDWTDTNQRKQYDAGLKELEDEINRRKQYLAQAQRLQKKDEFSAVANPESEKYDAAFDSKSGYVSTEQDGKLQRLMSQYSMGYDDLTYEYINNQNGIRDEIKHKARAYSKDETPFEKKGYDYMTEDEVGLYNYYYSMGGKKSAEAYLETIQEDLNQRKAAGMYQQMEGKTGAEMVFGVEAGLDQFKSGIKGAVRAVKGDDSYVAPSATQYASGMVREDLADDGFKLPAWLGGASLGQVGYDAITTTANMAPSIAVGMLNPTLGTAALGVSAGGSAYQEALNEGYSVDQARGYGILSGASEIVMEKVLGGISAYGGNALGKFFTQNMKNADTALKRIAKELGGSMLSEFSEEYLQEVLTPVFQNLTLGTDNEVKLVSAEALYAGFLGAITGGIMEGPQAIANARNATEVPGNATVKESLTTELANSEENATADNAEAVTEESSAVDNKMSATENAPTLEALSEKYGDRAADMRKTFMEGQDIEEYDRAFQMAYDMGKAGVNESYAQNSEATAYLSETQRSIAYNMGAMDAQSAAGAQAAKNAAAANGKTGWHKGTVKGQGVKIADMAKAFNDPQRKAYKYLSNIAEVTGVDIVLYKSETDADGNYQGAQGKFKWNENTIYIDINAGLDHYANADQLAKYTMMRTFDHEFTHFIEKQEPEGYNEFRSMVFATMEANGENVEDLIDKMMAKSGGELNYDQAAREVIAEAMTDILPETNFIEQLAQKNQNVFQQLLSKLKEFLTSLKSHFASMGESTREAKALKKQMGETVSYMEEIVKKFDEVAVKAVENYQRTVAEDVAVSKKEKTTETKSAESVTKEAVTGTEDTVSGTEDTVTETEESVTVSEESVIEPAEVVSEVANVASEDASPAPAAKEYRNEHGYTILPNEQYGSLEITFDSKPSQEVRDALKANKYRWNGKKGVWYGKTDQKTIVDALDKAYQPEVPAKSDFATAFENATQAERDEVVEAMEKNMGKISHMQPTEIREPVAPINTAEAETTTEEAVIHGEESENGSDPGAVQQPDAPGEGTPRLLEGMEPEAVQPGSDGRGPVRTGEYHGTADAGSDGPSDAAGSEPARSTLDSVGGDLQQLPAVTADTGSMNTHAAAKEYAADRGYRVEINKEAARRQMVQVDIYDKQNFPTFNPIIINTAEDWNKVKEAIDRREAADQAKAKEKQLHEEVQQEIEKKSTETPKGGNFVIGDSLDLPNGTKARTRANIEAIRIVKQLAAEGRYATAAEQEALSKYVGWGGLADAFGRPVSNRTTRKLEYEPVSGLEAEFQELREVLTDAEYKAARESTKNAHYTSIEVIKAMYDGLKHLGFTGGRMLEPSSGVGNFVGAMPADMTATVKSWTMVELDSITGQIAKYLYPNSDVRIQGFEETNIPDGYMDVAIGNVPFGNYGVTDKHYPKTVTGSIHNYFFAKALDKVRPGGLTMFITSHYTMDGRDNAVRKYIMQRADLLGAIRLPNTAFAGNAGTSVVTDILILKKRDAKTEYTGEGFENVTWSNGASINEYFANHPDMILGETVMGRGLYGYEMTVNPYKDKGSLGDQIRKAMESIQAKMEYPATVSPETANRQQANAKKRAQRLTVKNGVIHTQDEHGQLQKLEVDKDTADRITGMVGIRDANTELCDALQQGASKKIVNALRKKLNNQYDRFVDKYGYLNAPKNKAAIKAFADRYSILSLENYTPKTGKTPATATKADIFSKDTIAPNRTAAKADTVEEGLTISLNTVGTVDTAMIARLTGEPVESVTRQLIDQRLVFKDKDGNLIPAAQYLSGNVRAKLRTMEGLVGIDPDYRNNVEALKAVVPPTVEYTDIYVNPGATWVPTSVYEDFVGFILDRYNHQNWRTGKKDFQVEYVPETNEYKVSINDAYAKTSARNTQVWGESGKSFAQIFENMLNGRRTNVYMEGPDGKRVIDRVKTEAVAEKAEKLGEEFRKWLWEDEGRRGEMQELYNEAYNSLVTPKFSGESLTINGLNSAYSLRPHQKDAVARIINSGGNTLLAHRVGAGKTMEMAAAAMKLKQLGVIKKPMFVVPNNVVAQWGKEFKDYFPAANILLVGDEDMTPAERMTTINKIKNNDYDAVILAYTKFEKIQMTSAWRQRFYEEQIDSIMFAINAEKENQNGKGFTVKQLEAKRKQLEGKLKKLTDKEKDEDGAMFEDLGVDSLFVDEAHNFKNLEYSTRMNNVSGLGNADGSQRAFDLYTKVRYLQQLNGGRGIVFATATPVMNSMTEMYIMQRYLQPDTLKQLGIDNFDSWAKMFGEVVNTLEIAPSGSGYRLKQTFSKFKNVKALQQLFRSFTDVMTDIPGLKIPKMKGGKVQIVECEQGEFQKNYMAELAERAEKVKSVDPSEDNMLKITSDGRKISYSQRMIDPSMPYEESGKIYKCCENVWAVYQESAATRGTQMIFCDMATPKGKATTKASTDTDTDEFGAVDQESAQLYEDIKARLIQMGIPAHEIAFIHDAKNDKQKATLSAKMNDGTIRVLLGSTGKMGVGLNAQVKAVAIHHLDAPWRPGDIEQRDGRVFRQKNQNASAYKFVYVTKGSFDSRLWDILERKQKFINQVMNGNDVGNEIEDTGEVTLSAAEVKAVSSGNPLIAEQVALEKEISKLESLQQAHISGVNRAKEMIVKDEQRIAMLTKRVEDAKTDIAARKDTYSDEKKFSIQIAGQTYTDKKDAGLALVAAAQAEAKEGSYTTIGKFAGFSLRVVKTSEGITGVVAGAGNYGFKTYPLNATYGMNHLISVVEGLDGQLTTWQNSLTEAKKDLTIQKNLASDPFQQAEKLKTKRSRYREVMDILNPPVEQHLDSDSEDKVQYQRRNYLDDYRPKKPKKRSRYSETETLFLIWANGSAPVGEVKRFFRFGKVHYYVKSENGCIELSRAQYEERIDYNAQDFDRRAELEVSQAVNRDGDPERYSSGSINGDRYTGRTSDLSGQVIGEQLRNDLGGSVPGSWGDNRGDPINSDGTQNQRRYATLTDRDVLAIAANDLSTEDMTEAERGALEIFRDRLAKLDDLQEQRAQLGRTYKDQQFGQNVNREAAAETLKKMHAMDERIKEANSKVLDVEEKTVLRDVLKKARKVVEQAQKDHDQEILKRWRDRRNNAASIKKYQQRIAKDVKALSDWVIHPDNKDVVKHVPDVLKNAVIPFLTGIDFTSKRQLRGGSATKADAEFVKRLEKLQAALKTNIDETGLYSGYNDLPPQFMEKLQGFINAVKNLTAANSGEFVVNRMTSDELKALSEIVGTLKKLIQDCNKFHYNSMYHHVWEAGDATIDSLSQYKDAKSRSKAGETVDNFLFWQQIRPAFAWERFGKGGKAIYDGLRRGQARLAFNTKRIIDFSEKTYSAEEVLAWEKEVKEIGLDDGSVIRVKTAQAMSFYELSKDKDALRHILGQGIRVATYHAGKEKISDTGHLMSIEDVNAVIDSLTDRQKEVADQLQQFMATQGAKWGNFVSVKRFGEELFSNPTYFPINSDGRHLQANTDEMPENASLYALLNMGFTKSRNENANNRIVLYSIFDVFANHMASMAQYNALSLPVLDALKWFNYQQKEDVTVTENGEETVKHTVKDSVRDELNRVYGVAEETRPGSGRRGYAENFITGILKAFNGTEAQGIPTDETGLSMRQRYNMAQVAFNLRVVAQQPLAITRAGLLIPYRSIIRGMKLQPAAIQRNIAEMQKYSGIAAWKDLGFYDINISRGLTDLIKHKETWRDKVNETGMKWAEKADRITWAGIWSACKEEVVRRGTKPSDKGFFEAVSQLFEDVIYKTQVVDSVLTKNEYMRSKGFWARTTSSFMSEPVTNASMLIDAYDRLRMDQQKGMDFSEAWRRNKGNIGKTAYVYGMGAAVLAAVTAVMDAFRDDDEYETFLEKWSEAFSGNLIDELNPLGKLPLVKEISEFVKELAAAGWKVDVYGQMSNLPYIDMAEQFIKGVEIISDKINGVDTNYTLYGGAYKLLQGVSGISGLPMAATTREIVTIWNNTVGRMAPSYKVKTYDAGDKSNIKFAYEGGYLTDEEAMNELLSKGLSDNEDEAYWLIRQWDSGSDSFSRYDAINQAIRSGGSIDEAMKELTSHGYTEEKVRSQIKTNIGKWYQDGTITKQQTMDMLKKYSSLNRNEITEIVNRWSSKVVTGIAFDDIKEQFMSGDLSQSKAAEMYVRYGGYTKEKAAETVSVWAFVKKHPECDGITSHAVADYTTYCEKAGVPAKTFYQAWKHKNTLSGTVKAPMMEYINGLSLSRSQKDTLYYAFGWAESTIDEAPWH